MAQLKRIVTMQDRPEDSIKLCPCLHDEKQEAHLSSESVSSRGLLLLGGLELRHLRLQEHLAFLQLLPPGCLLPHSCHLRLQLVLSVPTVKEITTLV